MPKKQTTENSVPTNASEQPTARGLARTGRRATPVAAAGTAESPAKPAARRQKTVASGNSKKVAPARAVRQVQSPALTEDDRFREAVARLAYHFWEVRGRNEGSAHEDWARAETAVREVLEVLPRSSK